MTSQDATRAPLSSAVRSALAQASAPRYIAVAPATAARSAATRARCVSDTCTPNATTASASETTEVMMPVAVTVAEPSLESRRI